MPTSKLGGFQESPFFDKAGLFSGSWMQDLFKGLVDITDTKDTPLISSNKGISRIPRIKKIKDIPKEQSYPRFHDI